MLEHGIFKPDGLEKLGFDYIPPSLPHRERQMAEILESFEPVFRGTPDSFTPPVIYGPTGTGKTTTMKKLVESIRKSVKEMNLDCLHVNCSAAGKTFVIVQMILEKVSEAPTRGYSDFEMLQKAYSELDLRDEYLLLVLDDLDELIRRDRGRILLMIARIEESEGFSRRMFPVLILRNLQPFYALDRALVSKLGGPKIEFRPYGKKELKSIVDQRVDLAFLPDTVSNNAVEQISFNSAILGGGDARYAITLLQRSGFIALRRGSKAVLTDHVREAQHQLDNRMPVNLTEELDKAGILTLVAVADYFRENVDEYSVSKRKLIERCLNLSKKMLGREVPEEEIKMRVKQLISREVLFEEEGKVVFPLISANFLYVNLINAVT